MHCTSYALLDRITKKEGKIRVYESGMICIINVYDMCIYLPAMEKKNPEKKTEAHIKLDIKHQDTNRMMSMTSWIISYTGSHFLMTCMKWVSMSWSILFHRALKILF